MENIELVWKVENITVWSQLSTLTNVAYLVNYSVTAQNPPQWGNRIVYNAAILPPPTEETFVPYEQLTEPQVIGWVKDVLGPTEVAKIENEVWHGSLFMRSVFRATDLEAGKTYKIEMVGDTDWTLVGASENTLGISFVATGPGTGSGMASGVVPLAQPALPWV